MSATFTGGVTISGGWTLTAAPPSVATAGWFGGGTPGYQSTIQRITFATDTATASSRGKLSQGRYATTATGTLTDGWFGGGYIAPEVSTIDRITFANDTATATARGPLTTARASVAATSDGTTYGWFGGGTTSRFAGTKSSTVDRVTFANDTTTSTTKGPLATARYQQAAAGNTNYGWHVAGGFPNVNSVDRIDYANDTATASFRVSVTSRRELGGVGTASYGWFGGGYLGPRTSLVERITYASDTSAASTRGPLSLARRYLSTATVGDNSYGWFGGGNQDAGQVSTVDRIDYANDTATASVRGPMTAAIYNTGGTSGIQ